MNAQAKILLPILLAFALWAPPSRAEVVSSDGLAATIVSSGRTPNHVQKPSAAQRFDRRHRASDFVDLIKTIVRDRGADLCTRYGGDPDCIEEIEICFSMLDKDDDLMKICLNTAPEGRGPNRAEKTRLRR